MRLWNRRSKVFFSIEEISLLIALVAGLNPDRYKHASAKSLIYKCKAFIEEPKNG